MQSIDKNDRSIKIRGRRAATRTRFCGEIEIDRGSSVLKARVRDLSREGMFIEIAEWPSMGLNFGARLNLGTPLPLECTIQRVAQCQGIGVTFTLLDEDSRRRLNALLRVLRRAGRPMIVDPRVLPISEEDRYSSAYFLGE
jgi:hypothetical protein